MKKSILLKSIFTVLLVLLPTAPAMAANERIKCYELQSAQAITAGSSNTSGAVDLTRFEGYFSLQITLTGDGTAKAEYLLSNDETNYLEPSAGSDIAAGFVKTSGPGSDGKDIFSFNPPLSKKMKIKITETGAANAVTATTTLCLQ